MRRLRLLALALTVQVVLTGCAIAATELPASASRQSMSANGIEVELIATDWRGGTDVWVTVCYEIPTADPSWLIGRLNGDVILSDGSTLIPMGSIDLVGWKLRPDGVPYQRCDRVGFPMTEEPGEGMYTLTIRRIAADLPDEPDWAELQRRLDAAHTGIRIEPLPDAEGLSFALIERPAAMSDLEAHDVVVGMAGDVVEGPWVFEFRLRIAPPATETAG